MWDYATGKPFQHIVDVPQPGSLDAESGIFWCVSRLSYRSFVADLPLTRFILLVRLSQLDVRQDRNEAHHWWSRQDDQGSFLPFLSFPRFKKRVAKRVADSRLPFSFLQIYSEQG